MIGQVPRINCREAHKVLEADAGALLVCAYDDPEEFQQNCLEGAISLDEFRAQADTHPKDGVIIFYCA